MGEYAGLGEYPGLVLRLRTNLHMSVELLLGGQMLASVRAEPLLRSTSTQYVPLRLSVDAAGGVSVRLHSTTLLANVTLAEAPETTPETTPETRLWPLWRPQSHWRIGFGARTGLLSGDHHVRSISVRSA